MTLSGVGDVHIPFSQFTGVDFSAVRALRVTLSTFQGTIAISRVTLDSALPDCGNGYDDDGDGKIDAGSALRNDPGCADTDDPSERTPAFACDNGVDDDGDGRIDLRDDATGDAGCFSLLDSDETPEAACGIGAELALLLPLVAALRRGRRQSCRKAARSA